MFFGFNPKLHIHKYGKWLPGRYSGFQVKGCSFCNREVERSK